MKMEGGKEDSTFEVEGNIIYEKKMTLYKKCHFPNPTLVLKINKIIIQIKW